MSLDAQLLDQVSALLGRRNLTQVEVSDWWAGAADGGPNGNGLYPMTDSTGFVRLWPSFAKLLAERDAYFAPAVAAKVAAEAAAERLRIRGKFIPTTSNSYTLLADDEGMMLKWTGSATLSLRIPPTLREDWSCGLLQIGSGKIQPVALTGATLIHDQGFIRTRAAGSQANLYVYRNTGGAAAEAVLGGSVIA